MPVTRRIVIVGATSAIARHCARIWAAQGAVAFTLIGRDVARLERAAADLRAHGDAGVEVAVVDFHEPRAIAALVAGLCESAPPDIVLIAHGVLPDQAACEADMAATNDALQVNAVSPALFAQAFASAMSREGRGTIAIIGSVAGDRGRQSNYGYGASKALLDRFAQGLRHRFADTGVRIVLAKPGPTDTPMTAHLRGQATKLAPVEEVAQDIVRGIERGQAVVYSPARWWLVMMVIRHLPWFIFRRLKI